MSDYKKYVFTAAGIFIFLALGMFTMLFDILEKSKHSDLHFAEINKTEMIEPQLKMTAETELNANEQEKISPDKIAEKEIEDWYVYVTGAVKNPGIYRVSPDSRIFQAVEAAGGFADNADRASINLAQHLIDGCQINVREKTSKKINTQTVKNTPLIIPGTPPKTVNAVPPATVQNSEGKIDINYATEKELENLNGVGSAIAKRIVEYRKANGKFKSPEDLINVKGIGEAKLKKMRPQILIR